MSWSAKGVGSPAAALEAFVNVATSSWGYKHSAGDREAIDAAVAYATERVRYYGSNGVLTTILEVEGNGHWDDATGQGSATTTVRVLTDRRRK